MKDTIQKMCDIKTLGMINNTNLCDSCKYEFATCDGNNIIFGTAKGNDNVAACDLYTPLTIHKWAEEINTRTQNAVNVAKIITKNQIRKIDVNVIIE